MTRRKKNKKEEKNKKGKKEKKEEDPFGVGSEPPHVVVVQNDGEGEELGEGGERWLQMAPNRRRAMTNEESKARNKKINKTNFD